MILVKRATHCEPIFQTRNWGESVKHFTFLFDHFSSVMYLFCARKKIKKRTEKVLSVRRDQKTWTAGIFTGLEGLDGRNRKQAVLFLCWWMKWTYFFLQRCWKIRFHLHTSSNFIILLSRFVTSVSGRTCFSLACSCTHTENLIQKEPHNTAAINITPIL